MKAVVMNEYGGPEVLKFNDYPGPTPGPGRNSDKSRSGQHQSNRPFATLRCDEGFFPEHSAVSAARPYTPRKRKGARVIAGVRKSQLAEAKGLNADQVIAVEDDAGFDALAPVDVGANTVRGTTSELLLDKVKHGGTYAYVTGVADSAKSRLSGRAVVFDSKQDPKTLLYMAEAVRDGSLQIPILEKLRLKDAQQGHIAMEKDVAGKILLVA